MADSKYYKELYRNKLREAERYDNDIKELKNIRNFLSNELNDEIRDINGRIDELSGTLKKAVRHNSSFNINRDMLTTKKEKAVSADYNMSNAKREINEEIRRLSNKKEAAENDSAYYERMYMIKKEEEKKEFWENFYK